MTKARYVIATTAFLGGVGLFASDAVAVTTTFAGTECVEAADTTPEIYYGNGRAFNYNMSSDAIFECPIDRMDSDQPGSLTNIFARVYDGHPSEAVECHVVSCNACRTDCSASATDASTGSGSCQSLSLGSVSAFNNGFAYLTCDIPEKAGDGEAPRSGVYNYRVTD